MNPRIKPIAAALALLGATNVLAQAQELPALTVQATRIPYLETETTYASEIHTREMIDKSASTSLYDYLSKFTSLTVLPSYGNTATPKIDMRGYGIGDGYQNIVISVDGQRLNNIDMSGQLISAIPLNSIERIEITKGSGSVIHGDGANAGTIQIYTRPYQGLTIAASAGNYGAQAGSIAAGVKKENWWASFNVDSASLGGYSDKDSRGFRDASSVDTKIIKAGFRPVEGLKIEAEGSKSDIDTRYKGWLTKANFEQNPRQASTAAYTQQLFESDRWRVGAEYAVTKALTLTASRSQEDKISEYPSFNSKYDYRYTSNDLAAIYRGQLADLTLGYQTFDGTRSETTNKTTKQNVAYYAQGAYRLGALTLSAGARTEKVEYTYQPTAGTRLNRSKNHDAWDIGANYQLNDLYSVFGNYNSSYQAPDVDRFFSGFGVKTFNGFIDAAKVKTLNLGLNRVAPNNRFKAVAFHASLDNEIYYNAATFTNTNLDKTHKYGLELNQFWKPTQSLSLNGNYIYTRAIVDRENDGNGSFNGKNLPGVSRHSVNLGLSYEVTAKTELSLAQIWRSSSYAANDFANNFTQRQAPQKSTNLALRYRHNNLEWFAAVDNLFNQASGLWVRDDRIYPVNFTRNFRLGMKANF